MSRAVFLDRDGVINQKAPAEGYVTRWEDFHILPGVAEAVALLNKAGFDVIVITNQRCIAKGLLKISELEELHRRMSKALAGAGAIIDGIYYCPHAIEDACDCRKPEPGMLIEAARSRGIQLAASWMVGDSDIDMQAGRNAGCKTVRLLGAESGGIRPNELMAENQVEVVATSLLDAVNKILQREKIAIHSERAIRV